MEGGLGALEDTLARELADTQHLVLRLVLPTLIFKHMELHCCRERAHRRPAGSRLTSTAVMGPTAGSAHRTWLLTFSALCLLLWPLSNASPVPSSPSWSQEPKGKVLVVHPEAWRRCGSVALDPKDSMWSCCGLHYPFHRASQRCCSTNMDGFQVIPKDNSKSEYDDCRKYNRKDL